MCRASDCGTIHRSSSISKAIRISLSGILLNGTTRPSSRSTTAASSRFSDATKPRPIGVWSTYDGYAVVFIVFIMKVSAYHCPQRGQGGSPLVPMPSNRVANAGESEIPYLERGHHDGSSCRTAFVRGDTSGTSEDFDVC